MTLSRTNALLLYFLRSGAEKTKCPGLEGLSASDWEALIKESGRHDVAPLFYQRLKAFPPDSPIPDWMRRRLRLLYLQNAGRNTNLYHSLGKVLEVLRKNHIPVIALKGAHMAELVYGNIALRPMCDLDLLVKEKDLLRVEEILLDLGYRPVEDERQVSEKNRHFAYRLPGKELYVEIHWTLIRADYPFDIDLEGQWERARPAVIGNCAVWVQAPEDLLLHLCLHTCKDHLFENGLKFLCDLTETIGHYANEMDWNQVLFRSRQWGIEKSVYLTLRLAVELLKASVPEDLLKAIRPNDFEESYMGMAKTLIFEKTQDPDLLSFTADMARVWGPGRFSKKAVLFLKRVFPPPELMSRIYPVAAGSLRLYFYYPKRIKDVLQWHGSQVWRLLRRDERLTALAKHKYKIIPLMDWLGWPE